MYAIRSYYGLVKRNQRLASGQPRLEIFPQVLDVLDPRGDAQQRLADAEARLRFGGDRRVRHAPAVVITSYSIHYTKLYDPDGHAGRYRQAPRT